jgi:hypothetical protein
MARTLKQVGPRERLIFWLREAKWTTATQDNEGLNRPRAKIKTIAFLHGTGRQNDLWPVTFRSQPLRSGHSEQLRKGRLRCCL